MSIRTMDRVWKISTQSGGKLLLLLAIADFANDDGMAYPGIDTLAHKTRQSRRTVQRQLSELEKDHEIAIEPGTGRSNTNTYWVLSGLDQETQQKHIQHCQKLKGDKMTPFNPSIKGVISGKKGDIPGKERVTSDAKKTIKGDTTGKKGDTAMTPEPLLTVIKDNRQFKNYHEPSDLHQRLIRKYDEAYPQDMRTTLSLKDFTPAIRGDVLVLQCANEIFLDIGRKNIDRLNQLIAGMNTTCNCVKIEIANAPKLRGKLAVSV